MKIFVLTINENYNTIESYAKSLDSAAVVDRTRYKNKFHVRPAKIVSQVAKKFKGKVKIFDYDLKKLLVW